MLYVEIGCVCAANSFQINTSFIHNIDKPWFRYAKGNVSLQSSSFWERGHAKLLLESSKSHPCLPGMSNGWQLTKRSM
jgi:hypothetical protein